MNIKNNRSRVRGRGVWMIERLKTLIDSTEDKPKLKSLLLKVAEMPESKQEDTLTLIEMLLNARKDKWHPTNRNKKKQKKFPELHFSMRKYYEDMNKEDLSYNIELMESILIAMKKRLEELKWTTNRHQNKNFY